MARNNTFLKSALALAVASAVSSVVQGDSDVVISPTQPVTVNSSGKLNREILSSTSGNATVTLDYASGLFNIRSHCNSVSNDCRYKNEGSILSGGATYAVEVTNGSWYSLTNTGVINNSNGTAIHVQPGAGDFTLINSGSLISPESSPVISYQANSIFSLDSSGYIVGDIEIGIDSSTDELTFTDGSYSGDITGADQVTLTSNLVTMNGSVLLNGGSSSRYFKVYHGGGLQTSGLTVNGAPVTFESGSELYLKVNSANAATPVVKSNNSITVDGTIVVIPDDNHTGSVNYTLLSDSASVGGETPLIEVHDLYTVTQVTNSGSDLIASLTLIEDKQPEEVPGAGGANNNEQQVYKESFDAAQSASQGTGITKEQGEKLRNNLYRQYTPESSARLATELLPTLNRSSVDFGLHAATVANKATVSRMDGKTGVSSGDGKQHHAFWMQGLHNEAHQDDRKHHSSKIHGYHSRLNGFTMGLDADVRDYGIVGFAASYARGEVNKNDVEDETNIDTYLATLYGRWDMGDDYSLDVLLNYGVNKNERERAFDVDGTDLNPAMSEFDSNQVGIKAVLSRSMDVKGWSVSPMVGVHYSHFKVDEYTEKDSVARLKVEEQTYKIQELGAGFSLSKIFSSRWGDITPEARFMGWHDFAAEAVEVTSQFVIGGNTFVAEGVTPESTTWSGSAGFTWVRDQFDFSAGYERSWRNGFHSDSVYGRMEYRF